MAADASSLIEDSIHTAGQASPPWLSVLIPAYEHARGVRHILDRLYAGGPNGYGGVECLIGDDSCSEAVEDAVRSHPLFPTGVVQYRRHRPSLGAVPNWNDLLARARGDYVLLMHHDECPESDEFFPRLRQATVLQSEWPDLLLLECLLPTLGGRRLRHHVPTWLRKALMAWSPDHLLLHNTLGAPSVVVLRRERVQPFNQALKWLVDVEWMVRLLRPPGTRCVFARGLAIVSLPHAATSITASLRAQIPALRDVEARAIRGHLGPALVFRFLLPDSASARLLARVERMLWLALRVLTRVTGYISGRERPSWLLEST